jgi:hypothetical protein
MMDRARLRLGTKAVAALLTLLSAAAVTGCGSRFNIAGAPASQSTTFSVTDYGATGNGRTDDSVAILRAAAAAISAGGGTVQFPCGEYLVNTPAANAPGNRSILYIAGANSIALTGAGACSHILTTVEQKSLIEFSKGASITVSNLHLTAPNVLYQEHFGFGGGSALRLSGITGGSVTQLEIDGATAGAIYLTSGTSNVEVSGNTIHDTWGAGIWEDDCGGANASNCLPSLPPSNNVYASNTLTNTTQAQLAAIDLDDGNASVKAQVKDNVISWTHGPLASNPGVHCIQVNNGSDVSVTGNSCTGTPWDAIVVTTGPGGQSTGVTLQSNTINTTGFDSMGGSGIVVYDAPQGLGISSFTVAGNTIVTAGDDGIRLQADSKPGNIHDGTVSGNTIHDSDQRIKGTRFGIDLVGTLNIDTQSNTITGDGTCIAVGINAIQTGLTTAAFSTDMISAIIGVPLDVH